MPKDLTFDLSPAQSDYVHSDAEIVIIVGSMAEGKTYASIVSLMAHAVRCGRPIRGAIVRDTHQNIKISTVPDIQEVLGSRVSFHDDCKKMVIHSTPRVEMDLFGIDDPASLSKLQGPQYAIIWLEEPAPIIEKVNAGLPREVFDMAVARASRQAGTKMRVQISQNPADEDHWTEELANEPEIYAEDPETGVQIRKEVFRISYGENRYLNPQVRAANRAAFKDDPGKFARYVEGRAAPVKKGKSVTPEYDVLRHYAGNKILPIVPGGIGVRGWDAWHNPCCIIGQFIPPGKLWIHDVCVGENMGVKELIEQSVKPMLNSPKYKDKISDWRDMGDPTMRTPDQSTRTETAAKRVERMLNTRFESGPTSWKARIDPTKSSLLMSATDGSPRIFISKSAYLLHRALNGGWHWKKDNSGNIVGNLPVKDKFSHPGDAFCYMTALLFPYAKLNLRKKKSDPRARMKLARSYRGGNYGRKSAGGRGQGFGG
jgi:terminase large subunit-like protein